MALKHIARDSNLRGLKSMGIAFALILLSSFATPCTAQDTTAVKSSVIHAQNDTSNTVHFTYTPSILRVSKYKHLPSVHLGYEDVFAPMRFQPFFCKVEMQIERKSGLAPRFRLGSLDYTNWLEGKTDFKEY